MGRTGLGQRLDRPVQEGLEQATLLRQRMAVDHVLPIAKRRLQDSLEDDTEMYDGELEAAIEYASRA